MTDGFYYGVYYQYKPLDLIPRPPAAEALQETAAISLKLPLLSWRQQCDSSRGR